MDVPGVGARIGTARPRIEMPRLTAYAFVPHSRSRATRASGLGWPDRLSRPGIAGRHGPGDHQHLGKECSQRRAKAETNTLANRRGVDALPVLATVPRAVHPGQHRGRFDQTPLLVPLAGRGASGVVRCIGAGRDLVHSRRPRLPWRKVQADRLSVHARQRVHHLPRRLADRRDADGSGPDRMNLPGIRRSRGMAGPFT